MWSTLAACLARRAGRWKVGRTATISSRRRVTAAKAAAVDQARDAADVDPRRGEDPLDVGDHLRRRRVPLDADAALRRVHGARGTGERRPARRLAGVGRAEVEGIAGAPQADRVEVLPPQDLDADAVAVARRGELLDERRAVDAEVDRAGRDRRRQRVRIVVADDARAAAADVRLDDDGEAQAAGRRDHLGRVVDDAGGRVLEAQRLEERELARLRALDTDDLRAVDEP